MTSMSRWAGRSDTFPDDPHRFGVSAPSSASANDWIAEISRRALLGDTASVLIVALVAAGVPDADAHAVVVHTFASPILAAARELQRQGDAMGQVFKLRRDADPRAIEAREHIDENTLYREHWVCHRPLVLRSAAQHWPAAAWTFRDLQARFRFAPVSVSVRSPTWWTEDRLERRMAFGDLVDIALGLAGDGLYADGRSALFDQAAMAPLRAELGVLPGLTGDGHPRAWLGPAGTVTPTHHDQASGWLVQLIGHKRLHLASPLEPGLATSAVGLFHAMDPRTADVGDVRWHAIDLAPGDAVFTPVGWWHHLEAMEPSLSVSFSGFRWPNAFPWYVPGARV
jgi:hypothetical protein